MSLLKSIERLKRMNDLIRKEATGTAEEFASKIGISRSMLMENIREMKELGAEIEYCSFRRSYYYTSQFNLVIGREAQRKAVGSGFYLPLNDFFYKSPMASDTYRILSFCQELVTQS